jgi:DNA mismatch repair ATPase MutS
VIKNKKNYIELKSQTNGVHFTTKDLKALNEEYKDVTKDYEKKQSSLVKEVIQIAGELAEPSFFYLVLSLLSKAVTDDTPPHSILL